MRGRIQGLEQIISQAYPIAGDRVGLWSVSAVYAFSKIITLAAAQKLVLISMRQYLDLSKLITQLETAVDNDFTS